MLISHEGTHFPSCNFCLKKRMGEPAQFKTALQFGTKPTVGLQTQAVRHGLQRIRSHERVAIDFLIPNHGNV